MSAHLRLVESFEDRHWRRMEEAARHSDRVIDAMKIGLMGSLMRLVRDRLPEQYPEYRDELARIQEIERRVRGC